MYMYMVWTDLARDNLAMGGGGGPKYLTMEKQVINTIHILLDFVIAKCNGLES